MTQTELEVIRSILRRDYLTGTDWELAIRDLAAMAKLAVGASETLVAFYQAETDTWTAYTSEGEELPDQLIRFYGSRSVLERVRKTNEPLITTSRLPLALSSESLALHEIQSVVSVPLFWWDVRDQEPRRQFGGCLYAHRNVSHAAFTEENAELLIDLTELAQRNLNLLRYLGDIQADLEASRAELEKLKSSSSGQERFRLGDYETRDSWMADHVLAPLRRVCQADKVGILIVGPSGSGKTHLAQCFHRASVRNEGPFVVLDCAQITSGETLAAELFGYAPHSGYSNAPQKGRPGKAELADGGTLFIDEIGSLSADLQQRLLRLIQTGDYTPLGSGQERHVDVQIISATNEDLPALVRQGRFREDLFWRINELVVRLPALNDRVADIPELAQKFLRAANERFARQDATEFSPDALRLLCEQDWSRSGNIRGLQHVVNRAVLFAESNAMMIRPQHLDFLILGQTPAGQTASTLSSPSIAQEPLPSQITSDETSVKAPAINRKQLLQEKISEHYGNLTQMSQDPEVSAALGYVDRPLPVSTLKYRLRKKGLHTLVETAREQRKEELNPHRLSQLIQEHGSATAVADLLEVTRDTIIWRLRKEGWTVREILSSSDDDES